MKRRRYIRVVGTGMSVGVAGLAGCGSPSDDAGTEPAAGGANETVTSNEQGNATEAETATETVIEPSASGPDTVAMITEGSEYYFDPIGAFVESGGELTWENQSGSHSATAYVEGNPQAEVDRIPEEAQGWDSGTLSEEGATFSHTFEVEGTYDYYCIPHKTLEMVGRVVVGEPTGVDDDPPDGAVPQEEAIVGEGAISYEEFQSD